MPSRLLQASLVAPTLLALAFAGCADLLHYDDYTSPAASTSSGGSACTPGTTRACTVDGGACSAGIQLCRPDGTGFHACIGVVTPEAGAACTCAPGATTPCYDGPEATLGIGACYAGTATCKEDGAGWGDCEGSVLPALEHCSAIPSDPLNASDENCDGIAACAGHYRWAKLFGDAQEQLAKGVAVDADGNVIVVGQVAGDVDFGGGPTTPADPTSDKKDGDIFVLKLDPQGRFLWVRRIGDKNAQLAHRVAVGDEGDIVVAGDASGDVDFGDGKTLGPADPASDKTDLDIFVLKLDASGNLIWAKRFGDKAPQDAYGVALDKTGATLVAGGFQGSVDFGPKAGALTASGIDAFAAKLDANGVPVWAKGFGAPLNQFCNGVAVDATGNPVVTGQFVGAITVDQKYTSFGGADLFLGKLDKDTGAPVWVRHFGNPETIVGRKVTLDKDDNVIIAGTFSGSVGISVTPPLTLDSTSGADLNDFVIKLDPSGQTVVFGKAFGDPGFQHGEDVAVDGDGNVVLAVLLDGSADFGGGQLVSAGDYDMAVAKLDPMGNPLWSKRFGGGGHDIIAGIAADALGNVVVAGGAPTLIDFGGGQLVSADPTTYDIAIAKLAP